jgi:hypothetical protein
MMATELDKLLAEHGAVLVRQGKHMVYKLPNNKVFVKAKTPSDRRSELNQLSDLRKLLGLKKKIVAAVSTSTSASTSTSTPTPVPAAHAPASAPESPQPPESFVTRLEAAIALEKSIEDHYMLLAGEHEQARKMLESLRPFAENAQVPEILAEILGKLPAPEVVQAPQKQFVKVTRDQILAAAGELESFTISDMLGHLTRGMDVDADELHRAKGALAQMFTSLLGQGLLRKIKEHAGRAQAVWSK